MVLGADEALVLVELRHRAHAEGQLLAAALHVVFRCEIAIVNSGCGGARLEG